MFTKNNSVNFGLVLYGLIVSCTFPGLQSTSTNLSLQIEFSLQPVRLREIRHPSEIRKGKIVLYRQIGVGDPLRFGIWSSLFFVEDRVEFLQTHIRFPTTLYTYMWTFTESKNQLFPLSFFPAPPFLHYHLALDPQGSKKLTKHVQAAWAGVVHHNALSPMVAQQVLTTPIIIAGEDGTAFDAVKLKALRDNSTFVMRWGRWYTVIVMYVWTCRLSERWKTAHPSSPPRDECQHSEWFRRNVVEVFVGFGIYWQVKSSSMAMAVDCFL